MNEDIRRILDPILKEEIEYVTDVDNLLNDLLTTKYISPKKDNQFDFKDG